MSLLQYFPLRSRQGSPGSGVTISRPFAFRYSPTSGATVSTNDVTVTATFGTPAYTYAWDTDPAGNITVSSPTAATTHFTATGGAFADVYNNTFTCTVTDSLGAKGYVTCNVTIQIGGLPQ